jgi:hypothetical protein
MSHHVITTYGGYRRMRFRFSLAVTIVQWGRDDVILRKDVTA